MRYNAILVIVFSKKCNLCQHMDVLVFLFSPKNVTWKSMRLLGAKYMETFGCMSMPFGCMSMDRLAACMRLLGASLRGCLGAKYAVVGCKFHNG